MMTPDELRGHCRRLRAGTQATDDRLVAAVQADVAQYRTYLRRPRPPLPPPALAGRLPLMGWLIYETTWEMVQKIATSFDRPGAGAKQAEGEALLRRIDVLADAGRQLPWPEFAPRLLGAIRAQALAESKRDTAAGYDAAWILHGEALRYYEAFRDSHGTAESARAHRLSLDEVMLQLMLAETGTACRTAERVVARWAEEFAPGGTEDAANQWIQRMFTDTARGLEAGERAIEIGQWIEAEYGFVDEVDEFRLTRRSALQNPGIMTARAACLQLALGHGMRRLRRLPPGRYGSWDLWERDMLQRFERAYRVVEKDARDGRGEVIPMSRTFLRQLVHLRMNIALLKPGHSLPSRRVEPECLTIDPIDGKALGEISAWMAAPTGRGNERGIGAATMPEFIRAVLDCRGLGPDDRGYHEWRRAWFRLDSYADEPGRRAHMEAALAAVS
ncbi:hypothetical protein [Dactylosporangium darangshiense]